MGGVNVAQGGRKLHCAYIGQSASIKSVKCALKCEKFITKVYFEAGRLPDFKQSMLLLLCQTPVITLSNNFVGRV